MMKHRCTDPRFFTWLCIDFNGRNLSFPVGINLVFVALQPPDVVFYSFFTFYEQI